MARDFDVEGEIEFETLLDRLQDLKGKIKLWINIMEKSKQAAK
jgi:hypothetical protein